MKKKLEWKKIIASFSIMAAITMTACGASQGENMKAGMEAIEQMQYEESLVSFEKAIVGGENLELAYRGQGLAYMGMANYAEAITSFENALRQAGMFPGELEYDINYYLATARYKNGDAMGAIEALDAVIDLKNDSQDAYFLRGSAWMSVSEYEKAKKDFDKAVELSKSDTEMIIDVYEVLAHYEYKEEGVSYLNTLLKDHIKDMSDLEKGKVYFYLEDYENARNSLEVAKSSQKKQDATVILFLGKSYEALGDSEYAAGLYSGYLAENDPNPEIYNQLGLCKLETKDYQAALSAFTAGLSIEDNLLVQNLSYNQIVAYEYLGEFDQAKAAMKKYVETYPDDENAAREYIFLKTR